LVFFGSKLSPRVSGFTGSEAFDIQQTLSGGFVFQNLLLVKNGGGIGFPRPAILQEAAATAPIVILNSEDISYTGSLGSSGTVYFESVNFGPFVFNGQTVYARHLNPELCQTHVSASGGNLWILGLKTENCESRDCHLTSIPIGNVSNATGFEVLGASIYSAVVDDTTSAMFTFTNSPVSVSSMTTGAVSGHDYHQWIDETRNGTNHAVLCKNGDNTDTPCSGSVPHSYSKPSGSVIPLYIGH
jgi:hypothetical protein